MLLSSRISLPISIDTQVSIAINVQIAEQIKLLIAMGVLQPGDALPTVNQLAQHLGVNNNTVATVYNELIQSQYLVAQTEQETVVAHTQGVDSISKDKSLYNLLAQAFTAADKAGLKASEFGAAAYAQAVRINRQKSQSLKLVFVNSLPNDFDVNEAIKSEIGISCLLLQWEDLRDSQPKALADFFTADIVITTVQNLQNVKHMTTSEQEVIAIDIKPNLQLVTEISCFHRHANILLVGRERTDSEVMKRILQQAGISHVNFQALGIEELSQNIQLLWQSDGICASKLVEACVSRYIGQLSKIMIFDLYLHPANMSVLKSRIAAIQMEQSQVS